MGCLYCGKDIGPFRLLRDSEFCSAVHRKSYGERLGKALGQMSAPESAPAGIARFQILFPIQQAKSASISNGFVTHAHPTRIDGVWSVEVAPLEDSVRASDRAFAAPLADGVASAGEPPVPASCEASMRVPAAQAAERFVDFAFADALPTRHPAHSHRFAALTIATEEDAHEDVPSLCDGFMPAPAAQAVERFLNMAAKLELSALPVRLPSIADLAIPRTFVRSVAEHAPSLQPHAVAAYVVPAPDNRPVASRWPLAQLRFALHPVDEVAPATPVAQAPDLAAALPGLQPQPVESMPAVRALAVAALSTTPGIRTPHIACLTAQTLPQARAIDGPAAMPVESMPSAGHIRIAAVAMRPTLRKPILAHFKLATDAGEPLATPAPAAHPVAVESMPAFRVFAAVPVAGSPAILARGFHAELQAAFPMPRVPLRAPEAVEPRAAAYRPASFDPMARIEAQPAGGQPERPKPEVPHPGLIPLEFFSQRIAGSPVKRIEAIETRIAVQLPPFAIRPVLTAHARKKVLPFAEIFGPSSTSTRRSMTLTGKIAATVMVGLALWAGSHVANLSVHTEHLRADVASSERSLTVAEARDANAQFGSGPVGKLRRAIAERAATEVTDSFKAGMAAWGTQPKTFAAGWKRHPEGYVSVGEMAVFQPSVTYTDYKMEFYGQIEDKSMSWAVRAQDKKNYYAMKFKVIESGLRPMIAMVHYGVVNGKAGHKVETPLNVMVHNNEPLHVAVEVRGNRFTASIEGEPIETWTDDAAPKGGIGFFAEAGEKARLYWMRVSRNQDWVGRVCAYMSGDGRSRQQTAEVWGPEIPHQRPEPANRREADMVAALGEMKNPGRTRTRNERREQWIS